MLSGLSSRMPAVLHSAAKLFSAGLSIQFSGHQNWQHIIIISINIIIIVIIININYR